MFNPSAAAVITHKDMVAGLIIMALLIIGCTIENWRDRKRMTKDEHRLAEMWFIACGLGFLFLMFSMAIALAHDDGRYANSPLKSWFNQLASGKGLCCSFADGYAVEDADWETTADGKHYRVRIPDKTTPGDPMIWVDVPDEAVITEPNRAGRTMVWPIYGYQGATIRCFMPGPMT